MALAALTALALAGPGAAQAESDPRGAQDETEPVRCAQNMTLSTGDPDPAILSREASEGVRAFWCERYDESGQATRLGPYQEIYANGQVRTQALYIDSKLVGPVEILNEDGSPFMRGFLEKGEWSGDLVIFHETGEPWLEANFEDGKLHGELRTHHADGGLESETRFAQGREQGLARSFFATGAGGRLKSEARVSDDRLVGPHRLLDRKGALRREIDWNAGAGDWQAVGVPRQRPAAKPTTADAPETQGLEAVWPIEPTRPVGPASPRTGASRRDLDPPN